MKREIKIGSVTIGGRYPVAIQSMCNTKTEDVQATVAQIGRLEAAGCEIVRVAVPNSSAARAVSEIKRQIRIPLVADIHFDYRLALEAIERGVDKVRINPGNIGGSERILRVVEAAKSAGIPIRIGVNSGSVSADDAAKYGRERAMFEAVKREVLLLEREGFHDIVIAVKSSDVDETLRVCERVDAWCDYPLHIGITEAGTWYTGMIRSAVGLGILLHRGIGQTMRVSLSADPVEEIKCAKAILSSLGLRRFGVNVIACPTCGRTNVDVSQLAQQLEDALSGVKTPLTVAVMGCAVNGPGEAREADLGVAGGNGEYLLFRRGEIIGKLPENEVIPHLLEAVRELDEAAADGGCGAAEKDPKEQEDGCRGLSTIKRTKI